MNISIVIPALNEEKQIGTVLKTVISSGLFLEVIVVDDGSTDQTTKIAKMVGAKVISLGKNQGKGSAMMVGLNAAKSEIVMFLDADLVGLTKKHLTDLLAPLGNPKIAMTVADFHGGNFATFMGQTLSPAISGQRAIRKSFFLGLNLENIGYGAELALNKFAKKIN